MSRHARELKYPTTPYIAADWLAATAKGNHADIWQEPVEHDGWASFQFEHNGKIYAVEVSETSTVMGVVHAKEEADAR